MLVASGGRRCTDIPGAPTGVITHTYIRLRGAQISMNPGATALTADDITFYYARTNIARVTLTWGVVLMSFLNAFPRRSIRRHLTY